MTSNTEEQLQDEQLTFAAIIKDFLGSRQGSSDQALKTEAREYVRGLSEPNARALAAEFLYREFRHVRRAAALDIEQRAAHGHQPPAARPRPGTRAYHRWATETDEGRTWHARKMRDEEQLNARLSDELHRILGVYETDLRMQWTAELLAAEFSLGDGSTVTWGDATVAQHIERKAMYEKLAVRNIEGMSRHQQAINALAGSNARTLNDLVVRT